MIKEKNANVVIFLGFFKVWVASKLFTFFLLLHRTLKGTVSRENGDQFGL